MGAASSSANGYLTSTDWTTFNSKGSGTVTSVAALTLGTTGTDLSSSVATGTTTPVITLNVPTASASNRGVLSTVDWSKFNGKQDAITLTTTGTTGPATFSGSTLNIPQYAGSGTGTSILQTVLGGGALTSGQVVFGNFTNITGSATEATRRLPMPNACTLSKFYFLMSTNQPASGSLVLTIRNNGADTSLVITVAAGSVGGTYSNTSNTATFAAGDLMSIRFNNNATANSGGLGAFSCLMTI
jgi:hypothetical protein